MMMMMMMMMMIPPVFLRFCDVLGAGLLFEDNMPHWRMAILTSQNGEGTTFHALCWNVLGLSVDGKGSSFPNWSILLTHKKDYSKRLSVEDHGNKIMSKPGGS